jgi:hypothetical protein
VVEESFRDQVIQIDPGCCDRYLFFVGERAGKSLFFGGGDRKKEICGISGKYLEKIFLIQVLTNRISWCIIADVKGKGVFE